MPELRAHDISPATAREMHEAQLAMAQRGLWWKTPAFVAAFAVLWVATAVEPADRVQHAAWGLFVTAWFLRTLLNFRRLRSIDPQQRLIEDERDEQRTLADRLSVDLGTAAVPMSLILTFAGGIAAVSLAALLTRDGVSIAAAAGLYQSSLRDGDWWRLLTSSFVDRNAIHLGATLGVFIGVARFVTAYDGLGRVPFLYLLCAVGAGFGATLAADRAYVGQFGAVLGLVAYFVVLSFLRRGIPRLAREMALASVLLLLAGHWPEAGTINITALVGGLIAGILLARIRAASPAEPAGHAITRVGLLGWVSTAVLAGGALLTLLRLFGPVR